MPANPASLRVTERYRSRMVAIRKSAQSEARKTWAKIDQADLSGTYQIGMLALTVSILQREAARLSGAYLKAFTESELGHPVREMIVDATMVGEARNGDNLRETLMSPLIGVKAGIKAGKTPAQALHDERSALERIVGLATDTAARESLHRAMHAAPQVTGWQRAIKGTCGACMGDVKSDKVSTETPLNVHPNCQCVAEPVVEREKWFWDDDEKRFSLAVPDEMAAAAPTDSAVRDAALKYSTGAYRDLNARLMEGTALTAEQEQLAAQLRGAMVDLPAKPTVWRGIKPRTPEGPGLYSEAERYEAMADAAEDAYKVDDVLTMKGFQSTSFDVGPPLNGAASRRWPGVIFEIRARRGVYIADAARYDDEAELLLPDNARFRVRKVLRRAVLKQDEGDAVERTVIQLEQL